LIFVGNIKRTSRTAKYRQKITNNGLHPTLHSISFYYSHISIC
jgi:hypothetical protein